MNLALGHEAVAFGESARKALDAAGGDELVRRIEVAPETRERVVGGLLGGLGAWDIDPRRGPDELEACAALCRAVGHWAVPYPVAERLCRTTGGDVDGLLVVSEAHPAAAVAGLDLRWEAITVDGRRSPVRPRPLRRPPRTSAFADDLELAPPTAAAGRGDAARDRTDVALGLTLPCWTLLGMLGRAVALTRDHVLGREQFGTPLATFQGVQFQLTDAEVERAGAEVLALYALWSIASGQPSVVQDALACRVAVVEAAEVVLRVAHQLHGAGGLCDETTLSWLSRYSTPLRRLPYGPAACAVELERAVGRRGLPGPFAPGDP